MKILMLSDFVYPGLGGVETHIYQLSSCMIELGHEVVIFSHSRELKKPENAVAEIEGAIHRPYYRHGIRYLANGVKAYYYSYPIMYENCTWAQPIACLPILRDILVRERIDLVHAHQAPSSITLECLGHCANLGYPTVFTDHSLFGFADSACIHVNKCLKIWLALVDACISVSYTNKENLCLRASIPPHKIHVIPNALDYKLFTPSPHLPDKGPVNPGPDVVNVVMIGRLTFRKGTDLLARAIPIIAKAIPAHQVRFIIGGDGPKQMILEEMRERYGLYDQVVMLGGLSLEQVRQTLRRGQVFINASLTEAFCIGILEAACSGLLVVCTNVGGVTEVLPPHLATFVECTPGAIAEGAIAAIRKVQRGEWDPWAIHKEVGPMYNWRDVAQRVSKVYENVRAKPIEYYPKIAHRWALSWDYSSWANMYIYFVQLIYMLFWKAWRPLESISMAVDVSADELLKGYCDLQESRALEQ